MFDLLTQAAKFIGAPPGYVGYGSAKEGQLLSLLRRNPRAIVLFDEADKAHPNVLSTLLQVCCNGTGVNYIGPQHC